VYFDFPLAVSFHHCSILIFILSSKLLLTEGQAGETWAPYNKTDDFSEILVHKDTEVRPFFVSLLVNSVIEPKFGSPLLA
jgi:hypothetical protein